MRREEHKECIKMAKRKLETGGLIPVTGDWRLKTEDWKLEA